ncbi:MAG: hypothetical protein AB7P76_10820 [Candidatus Melainabacteria bacterium]
MFPLLRFPDIPPRTALWLGMAGVCAFAVLVLLRQNVADLDLWGVLSFGALLAVNNPQGIFTPDFYFPGHDIFSFTAHGAPWIYHEWGAGVLFFQILTHWGSPALFLLKVILLAGTLALTAATGWRRLQQTGHTPASLWVTLWLGMLILSIPYWLGAYTLTIRCHTLSFFLFALGLFLLDRLRACDWPWCVLPALFCLWANVHGGFLVGLLAVGLWAVDRFLAETTKQRWQPVALLTLCGLATLVNPWGPGLWQELISAWGLPRTDIHEWQPVFSISPAYGWGFVLLVLTLSGSALVTWRLQRGKAARRRLPVEALLLLLTGMEGLLHLKLMPLFVVSALAWGIPALAAGARAERWARRGLSAFCVVSLGMMMAAGTAITRLAHENPGWLRVRVPDLGAADAPVQYPVAATQALESMPAGRSPENPERLWAPYGWGEYLYWHLYPGTLIGMDGRYETVYPPALLKQAVRFFEQPANDTAGAMQQLIRLRATLVMVPAAAGDLINTLNAQPAWRPLWRDGQVSIYQLRRPRFTDRPVKPQNPNLPYLEDHLGDLRRFSDRKQANEHTK